MRKCATAIALLSVPCSALQAGLLGLSTETQAIDQSSWVGSDPRDLYLVSVYADFSNPKDRVIAVYGSNSNATSLSVITDDPAGFWQCDLAGKGSPWWYNTSMNISGLILDLWPSAAYDSFLTIGLRNATWNELQEIGIDPLGEWDPFNDGSGYLNVSNGAIFVPPDGFQGLAGSYSSVLIGQFAVGSGSSLSGTFNVQWRDAKGQTNYGTNLNFKTVVEGSPDQDDDGVPNDTDNCPSTPNPLQEDCDGDGIGDACALDLGADTDCNGNGFPDRCDVIYFSSFDCNFNLIPDECESDCDGDGLIDDCDSEPDVDGNGVPDNCDPDCNQNGVPDGFEIENGFAQDCDGNGVIDACELLAFRLESVIEGPAVESGRSVAIDGDVAVVGSPALLGSGDEGTAEVYRFDGSDWVLETTLVTPGPASNSEVFGRSVDIDDDRLIVGAGRLHWNSSGSAFVFRFDGDFWWPEGWLTPFGGSSDSRFGVSVAIDDGRAIVGSGGYESQSSEPGRIFAYEYENADWIGSDTVQAPQFPWRQDFGYAVAMEGDRVLASAGGDPAFSPRAFGFRLNSKGVLQHEATLQSNATSGSEVGIGLSPSWAAVGSPQSVGIYDANWLGVDSITASGGEFGAALALSDDLLAVSRYDQDGTNVMQIMRFDGFWSDLTDIVVDAFARVAAISGSTMAVGSPAAGQEGLTRIYREADCDLNGIMDVCEIAEDPSLDCNEDGLLDICGIEDGLHADCNGNGVPDECDVADPDMDLNGNGIPDECECLADLSGATICTPDGIVGTDDILAVIGFWNTTAACGDANLDGIVGTDDILAIISNWGPCAGFRDAPPSEPRPAGVPTSRTPQKPSGESPAAIGRAK